MITFLIAVAALIVGYFTYGLFMARFFGADSKRPTPVTRHADGVDFIQIPTWKAFVIQFLNIAGLGPIFGAILGAMYGPVAYIWIVLGCIFMGAVHDYFSGMLSIRHDGANLPEIVRHYLGRNAGVVLRVFTILLLVCVGVSFVKGPAELLASLTGFSGSVGMTVWIVAIFGYYIVATLLPINQIIGRIYPFLGATLLIMALMIGGSMLYYTATGQMTMTELSVSQLRNMHSNPESNILFPMLFVVISCGAISGFHSTQSPLMARTIKNEKYGLPIFYGAMIAEGIMTLIWATVAINYFGNTGELNDFITSGHTPAYLVNEICNHWLGKVGAVLAIIGIIACPITTGDTAFRSARLTIAETFRKNQAKLKNRLLITLPMFAVAIIMSQMTFSTIWNYVGISNQVLSVIMLWTAATYLKKNHKPHWLLSVPALFMTCVCTSYFLVAPGKVGGLSCDPTVSYITAAVFCTVCAAWFLKKK